ncbi:hypothetical protein HZA85_01005 [Candidatus Uhrbacteria bacterium]|nr:hypothetical protein [Candidatus Uhrbacteria bacterium]
MSFFETAVFWPDLKISATTTRALTVMRSGTTTQLDPVSLIVLVNDCLYIVACDGQGLRAGQILSRNLDLTRRNGGHPSDLSSQVFVVYDGIYEARRGLGRIDDRYRGVEVPELARSQMDADWLMRASWTLARAEPDAEDRFVWRAQSRAERHRSDRASLKVRAFTRFVKIATLKDATGRRNTGAIPLQCTASERDLQARVQEVRGIGRRMEWRAVVLEHYIDQLRRECWAIRRAAQDALESSEIFGDKRTPRALRIRANRMAQYGEFLKDMRVRRFSRVFTHVSQELAQIAGLMHDAADARSKEPLNDVRALLSKIYRSMMLVDEAWRLEEILVVVAEHHAHGTILSPNERRLILDELRAIHSTLTSKDPLTGEPIDKDFATDILPTVIGNVLLARIDLEDQQADPSALIRHLYDHLKVACHPI